MCKNYYYFDMKYRGLSVLSLKYNVGLLDINGFNIYVMIYFR